VRLNVGASSDILWDKVISQKSLQFCSQVHFTCDILHYLAENGY
jgi:hypothetical protein